MKSFIANNAATNFQSVLFACVKMLKKLRGFEEYIFNSRRDAGKGKRGRDNESGSYGNVKNFKTGCVAPMARNGRERKGVHSFPPLAPPRSSPGCSLTLCTARDVRRTFNFSLHRELGRGLSCCCFRLGKITETLCGRRGQCKRVE